MSIIKSHAVNVGGMQTPRSCAGNMVRTEARSRRLHDLLKIYA